MKVSGETCGVTVLKNIQHIPYYIRVSRFISGLGAVTMNPSLDFLVGDRRHICSLSVINKNYVNHTAPQPLEAAMHGLVLLVRTTKILLNGLECSVMFY
jgi:hypothetical protein